MDSTLDQRLLAEIRELKGNFSREIPASGIIVESELDKGKGVVSTVLVQRGVVLASTMAHAGGSWAARNLAQAFLTSSRTQICLGASCLM